MDDLLRELADRFGPLPDEVRALGYLSTVKIQAVALGLEAVTFRDGSLTLRPFPTGRLDQTALRRLFRDYLFIGPTSLRLTTNGLKLTWEEALEKIFALMHEAKARIESATNTTAVPSERTPEQQERHNQRKRERRMRERVINR